MLRSFREPAHWCFTCQGCEGGNYRVVVVLFTCFSFFLSPAVMFTLHISIIQHMPENESVNFIAWIKPTPSRGPYAPVSSSFKPPKEKPFSIFFTVVKMGLNSDVNEFENTKAGVKGLVDTGITKVPDMFILPPKYQVETTTDSVATSQLAVPVIDLEGYKSDRRAQIINEIGRVSETWGIFYMVNHGVPLEVMNKMLECMRLFHEQPNDEKMAYYSRDPTKKVNYYTSYQGVLKTYLWKDSLSCELEDMSNTELLPLVCREAMRDYTTHMIRLKDKLAALLSEALGLSSDHLESIRCMEAQKVFGHYYPACPEPDLTMGTTHHSDPFFLTILLTNSIDGLQVLHQNQWIDAPPMEGALICNIGDLLQLITNDLLKSAEHRVLARSIGPRLSVACFFYQGSKNKEKKYGVIEEILSDKNPPLYKEISFDDYFTYFRSNRVVGTKALLHFRQ